MGDFNSCLTIREGAILYVCIMNPAELPNNLHAYLIVPSKHTDCLHVYFLSIV